MFKPRRQPLLPARQHRRPQERRRSAKRHGSRHFGLAAFAALLACVAAVVVLWMYWRVPGPQPDAAATEEEQRDAAHEMHLLHQPPSAHFCALPPPLVCAHGGDSSRGAPPNTAAAFAAALDGGARCVEVDVARSRDGQLVVLHTRELQHLLKLAGKAAPQHHRRLASTSASSSGGSSSGGSASGRGGQQEAAPQVGDFTWPELQQLRWEGGHGVELAETVLQQVRGHTDHITLDVKTHSQDGQDIHTEAMAQQVLDLVARTRCFHCLVWAKSDAVVRQVKRLNPAQQVGYIVLNETAAARAAGMHRLLRLPDAEVIGLHYAMVTAEISKLARQARQRVHAWTANTPSMIRQVLDAGVEAVVTNHPALLQQAILAGIRSCRQKRQQGGQEAAAGTAHQEEQQGAEEGQAPHQQ